MSGNVKKRLYFCGKCGCELDPGEGNMCEECKREIKKIQKYASQWSLTYEQAEELYQMGLVST